MVCAKRSYLTKQEAKLALASMTTSWKIENNPRRREIRFYRCPNCKTYHITSHETI